MITHRYIYEFKRTSEVIRSHTYKNIVVYIFVSMKYQYLSVIIRNSFIFVKALLSREGEIK